MTSFTIGVSGGEHLTVYALNAAKAIHRHYDWVDVEVSVKAGGFTGSFGASFMTHDFAAFRSGLEHIYRELDGTTKFETTEEQLEFEITGDGKGHFRVNGVARDMVGTGNKLKFHLNFDQTNIPTIIQGLDEILTRYPT